MEAFATVITAGGLILQFLDACSAYSEDAKSLKARFDWDIRVLEVLSDYFAQRQVLKANQLAPKDAALLEQTASYLDGFLSKVQKTLWKIQRKGWMHDSIRRAMWIARRADLKEMEKEMFEWTRRFDVRLLGLPPELRKIIPATSAGDEARPPAVVRSNTRLKEFLALASNAKQTRVKGMLLEDSDELASKVTTRRRDVSFQPLQHGTEQIIFASRRVPPGRIPGTSDFERMTYEMGELAAALNCLDPAADIRLLKVEYYFYHADGHQFLFAQSPPYATMSMMTLEDMIRGDPFPEVESPLDERLKLAHKIAEAVFFLHAAGFLHKNITSSSVVALRRSHLPPGEVMPDLGDSYLMGFDLIRGSEAITINEGVIKETEEVRSVWDFDVFQHPERLQGGSIPRYIKTYDFYSLGVVLLEVGFWQPLRVIARDLSQDNPSVWAKELSEIVPQLGARTGERYQRLVAWCLDLKGDHIVKDAEFLYEVLDPLEEIVNALSLENGLNK